VDTEQSGGRVTASLADHAEEYGGLRDYWERGMRYAFG